MVSSSSSAKSPTEQPTLASLVLDFVVAVGATLGFGVIAFTFGRGIFLQIDQRALWSAFELREFEAWLTPIMVSATNLGSIMGLLIQAIIVVAIMYWRNDAVTRNQIIRFAITTIGAMILFVLLKNQIARPRPSLYPSPYHITTYSFPSGHSLSSSAFYGGVIQLCIPHIKHRWRRWLLLIGCAILVMLIGVSRMYFSVHYPTDVLGGYIGGIAWLFAIQSIWQGVAWRRNGRDSTIGDRR